MSEVLASLPVPLEALAAGAAVVGLLVAGMLTVFLSSARGRAAKTRAAAQTDGPRTTRAADNAELARLRQRLAEIERAMEDLQQAFAARLQERPAEPAIVPQAAAAAAAPAPEEAAKLSAVIGVQDQLFARVYASTLANMGYEVARSQDGDEVMRWASEKKPSVLVVDLALPVLDGGRGVKELRRRCPGARIMVLAPNDQTPLPAGADHVLSHPFGPLELARRLKQGGRIEAPKAGVK